MMKLAAILIMGTIFSSFSGCSGNKYEIVGAGNSCAYKMDKSTGQVWFISPDGERKLLLVP